MRVNMHVDTSFSPVTGRTGFEIRVYAHDDNEHMRHGVIYESVEFAQQPNEDMNLNLWATALLRGLVARMEETFLWVEHRPQAILIEDLGEHKNP